MPTPELVKQLIHQLATTDNTDSNIKAIQEYCFKEHLPLEKTNHIESDLRNQNLLSGLEIKKTAGLYDKQVLSLMGAAEKKISRLDKKNLGQFEPHFPWELEVFLILHGSEELQAQVIARYLLYIKASTDEVKINHLLSDLGMPLIFKKRIESHIIRFSSPEKSEKKTTGFFFQPPPMESIYIAMKTARKIYQFDLAIQRLFINADLHDYSADLKNNEDEQIMLRLKLLNRNYHSVVPEENQNIKIEVEEKLAQRESNKIRNIDLLLIIIEFLDSLQIEKFYGVHDGFEVESAQSLIVLLEKSNLLEEDQEQTVREKIKELRKSSGNLEFIKMLDDLEETIRPRCQPLVVGQKRKK